MEGVDHAGSSAFVGGELESDFVSLSCAVGCVWPCGGGLDLLVVAREGTVKMRLDVSFAFTNG